MAQSWKRTVLISAFSRQRYHPRRRFLSSHRDTLRRKKNPGRKFRAFVHRLNLTDFLQSSEFLLKLAAHIDAPDLM